uniref:Centrosomal protein POC5 n=1 Tax=Trichobilharzia regenti TaxID=157069 RepID=A0AA85KCT2_TRIRE|nr:unnamed protein product [Trichobilharzia regenti]
MSESQRHLQVHYQSVQKEIMSAVKGLFSVEMHRIKTDMIKLHEQVISLRDLARNHERTIAQKDQLISELTDEIKRMKHNMQVSLKEQDAKRKEFCIQLADRYYKQRILKQAIIEWKQYMECTWKQRNFRRLTLEAQSECIKIKKEFNEKILQLEAELKISQGELDSVKAKQASEQAALKTALMRGVCALNMETMAVFNETLTNLNKEYENKKSIFNEHDIKEQNSTQDPLLALTEMKQKNFTGNYQLDKSENMINFNIQHTNHHHQQHHRIVQSTYQSNNRLPDQNKLNAIESWPRNTLHSFESPYYVGSRKDKYTKPLNHSAEICERWLGNQDDYTDRKDPLDLSDLPNYKMSSNYLQNTHGFSYQLDEKVSSSEYSEAERDGQSDYQRPSNTDLLTNTPYDSCYKSDINSSHYKHEKTDHGLFDVKNQISVESAKKMLSSRNSSNRAYSTEKQNKSSAYNIKAHTVQHGIPTGTLPNGSTIAANILVHRHQPVSQVMTKTAGVNFSRCLHPSPPHHHHQHSSAPRLCSDSYSHKHV